ncbi:RNA polymerase sigma factor [Longimicrobium terrae]|uniref:RNA polymerase sigma-70 factor (ECF subfamily) n=1 Tax=Longimicrobium terrae TaxID=1639882 RepID=A0A841H1Q9_9BACT|nr:sigma-70 family RNA polymerase sigma factor [Longimicrobium terrae]MBB4637511.1 RNA polymerase sigma-70 factor (ECF subfamily) [Longimicrobium terrae]MBB6071908.1 RNA polymerase sigma-70 factor (ECF subfamily) [Longimicrobium terrae]NNC30455.1 sigma-70 family RNA polymerase sigma factor [Longimicrobium terrae]
MPVTAVFDLAAVATRAAGGDDEALEMLLRELHPLLCRYFGRRCRDEPDMSDVVDDLAQQTLVQLARGMPQCRARDEAAVLAWALSIARNCAADHLRAVREERSLRCFFSDLEIAAGWSSVQEWRSADAESSAGRAALGRLLEQVQDSLPERTQDLLWMRLVEHAPWGEVADHFGTEYRAAQRRYQRAQKALRSGVLSLVAELPDGERDLVLAQLDDFGVRVGAAWRDEAT